MSINTITHAVSKSIISAESMSFDAGRHMRNTVLQFIINTILSEGFQQRSLDQLLERARTESGIVDIYNEIIVLAVDAFYRSK